MAIAFMSDYQKNLPTFKMKFGLIYKEETNIFLNLKQKYIS